MKSNLIETFFSKEVFDAIIVSCHSDIDVENDTSYQEANDVLYKTSSNEIYGGLNLSSYGKSNNRSVKSSYYENNASLDESYSNESDSSYCINDIASEDSSDELLDKKQTTKKIKRCIVVDSIMPISIRRRNREEFYRNIRENLERVMDPVIHIDFVEEISISDTEIPDITLCSHGYDSHICFACGSRVCTHPNLKSGYYCTDCGKGCCIHKCSKYHCRNCGTGLCSHGKYRHNCRFCGNLYCIHGKNKYYCEHCKTGVSKHNKMEVRCKECSDNIYLHDRCNRDKPYINEKKRISSEICDKDKTKSCDRNNRKYKCKEDETGFCQHKEIKYQHRECEPEDSFQRIGFSSHNRRKNQCRDYEPEDSFQNRFKYNCPYCKIEKKRKREEYNNEREIKKRRKN